MEGEERDPLATLAIEARDIEAIVAGARKNLGYLASLEGESWALAAEMQDRASQEIRERSLVIEPLCGQVSKKLEEFERARDLCRTLQEDGETVRREAIGREERLKVELESARASETALRARNEELRQGGHREVGELRSDLEATKFLAAHLKGENEELRRVGGQHERELDELRDDLEAARARVDELNTENGTLQSEREDAVTDLGAARAREAGLKRRIEEMRGEEARLLDMVRELEEGKARLEKQQQQQQQQKQKQMDDMTSGKGGCDEDEKGEAAVNGRLSKHNIQLSYDLALCRSQLAAAQARNDELARWAFHSISKVQGLAPRM
jgi:chromosome segregation ATPase